MYGSPSGPGPRRGTAYDEERVATLPNLPSQVIFANNTSQQSQGFLCPEENSTTWLLPTALDWLSNDYVYQASQGFSNTPTIDASNRFINGISSSPSILTCQSSGPSPMFLRDDLVAYWNPPIDPNSIREHPADEDGSNQPLRSLIACRAMTNIPSTIQSILCRAQIAKTLSRTRNSLQFL